MGITIVGLGPGDGRFLTREAWELLAGAEQIFLRTARHPAANDLPAAVATMSFDPLYETADSFAAVYEQIVERLLAEAARGDVIYAVPGHPFVGESSVARLVAAARAAGVGVRVVAGLSFVEPVLTAIGHDALDGLQLFDALDIAQRHQPPINPDQPLLLGQVYNRTIAGDLKLNLMQLYPDEHPVSLIHAAGTAAEAVERIPLYAIDRSPQLDHLSSLFVPPLPYVASLSGLAETVAILRSPEGCPWDQEQTPQSMRPTFLEEAHEVLAAIDRGDVDELREELGDLLYHIVMQAQMAVEEGAFSLTEVLAGIDAKLKRRHPHVWGDWEVSGSAEVLHNWEILKQAEKTIAGASLLDGIPEALPALARSQKIQERVARSGFDWPDVAGVEDKIAEELAELQRAATPAERSAELGDLLFVMVNWARWQDLDAETALREANLRFGRRFRHMEAVAQTRGLDLAELDLEALERLWQEAKLTE